MSSVRPVPRTGFLSHPLVDRYLSFVEARTRPNTVLATASDLRIFFDVVGKEPTTVTTEDVLEFLQDQRRPFYDGKIVRLSDGESGLRASTIKRRLSSVSGFYAYLAMVGKLGANPVPRGSPPAVGAGVGTSSSPWCERRGSSQRSSSPTRSTSCSEPYATTGTGPWSRPWCSVACAAARCWGCAWATYAPANAGSLSSRARVAISASPPSRPAFSARWGPTWAPNGPALPAPSVSLSC